MNELEKFKSDLSDDDLETFKIISKSYQIGPRKNGIGIISESYRVFEDIISYINTIDFPQTNRNSNRKTKCYNNQCNKPVLNEKTHFICSTCGWFICICGSCGCSKLKSRNGKTVKFVEDTSRNNSSRKYKALQVLTHPIKYLDFKSIFKDSAIVHFNTTKDVPCYFDRKNDQTKLAL